MSPELIGVLGIIVLIALICMRVWVGVALGVVGFLGLALMRDFSYALSIISSAPFSNLNSYTLTVVPMFTLMGMVISVSSIGSGLYRGAESFVGHLRGGLASATVIACAFLGAITGGQYGATVIMSKIALPEMRKRGYNDELSGACIASAAPLAIVIPPSVSMIFFGILTETSVGHLFMGGLIPGVLCAAAFCVTVWIVCRIKPEMGPPGERHSWKERLIALRNMWPTLLLVLCVIGTIYLNLATTTESGAIGAVGAILIAFFMRELTWEKMKFCLVETAKTCGGILFLLAGSYVFTSFISVSKLPFLLTEFITQLHVPAIVLMMALAVL